MAQDEETARGLMEELDSMYLLLDYPTAIYKFYAVSEWAGEQKEDYFDKYFQEQNGVLKSVYLFYPEYYQTLLVRLYFFEGKAVTPEVTTVINFVEKQTSDGQTFKEITGVKQLASYREAQAFIESANEGNYRIVSTDPFSSPVPLAPLEHYRLVYRSEASSSPGNSKNPTPVKAFIYLGDIVPVSPSPGGDRSES
jgi:asparagine N-glycosylation enzyme membrane subunit Stt3